MTSGAGHWVTLQGGQHIFIGGEGDRASRARASEVKFTKRKMSIALSNEAVVAGAIGGTDLRDNEPFDIIAGNKAIKVKTLIAGKNPKITMRQDALDRKMFYSSMMNLSPHTVVVDVRGSHPIYYHKPGVGSFRLSNMTQVTLPELRNLIHG